MAKCAFLPLRCSALSTEDSHYQNFEIRDFHWSVDAARALSFGRTSKPSRLRAFQTSIFTFLAGRATSSLQKMVMVDDFLSVTFLLGWVECSSISPSGRGRGVGFWQKITWKCENVATRLPTPLRVARWCRHRFAMDSGRLARVFARAPSHTPELGQILSVSQGSVHQMQRYYAISPARGARWGARRRGGVS